MIVSIVRKKLSFDSLEHEQAFRSGRTRHNLKRQRQVRARRAKLVQALASGKFKANKPAALAKHLGVSRLTIWRDIKALEEGERCQHCGALHPIPAD
jgi:DNA invertase Pin-like site-specific DNA recombinase